MQRNERIRFLVTEDRPTTRGRLQYRPGRASQVRKQCLVMSMGSRLQAVSDYKNNDFEALKMGDYVKKWL